MRYLDIEGGALCSFLNTCPLDVRDPQQFLQKARSLCVADARVTWYREIASNQTMSEKDAVKWFEQLMSSMITAHKSYDNRLFTGDARLAIRQAKALAQLEFATAGLVLARTLDPDGAVMPKGVPGFNDSYWDIQVSEMFPDEIYQRFALNRIDNPNPPL